MSHFYGQYRFPSLRDASPEGKISKFDLSVFIMQINRGLFEGTISLPEKEVHKIAGLVKTEFSVYKGNGEHLFVDSDTEKVIENAIRKLSNKDMAKYVPARDEGIIYREGKDPVLFCSLAREETGFTILCINDESGCYWQSGIEQGESPVSMKSGKALEATQLKDSLRFVLGVFMMRECFPDAFKDGLPRMIKQPNWYKRQKNTRITIDHIARTVCPHIRSGHFRLLSSPRFTKKQGQVLFVKASMVHGKAQHTEKENAVHEN